MLPNPTPGTAREWLARAKGKLAVARQPLPPGGYWEDLCFLAQQGAELAMKAVYQQQGWPFPFVHDLGRLLDGLIERGLAVPDDVQMADELTIYATQTRYPGVAELISQQDWQQALSTAQAVVAWAETIVR